MVKRKVFVTGASGRLGKYVVDLLIANDYEVIALSRHGNIEGCRTIIGDVFDFDYSQVKGCDFAVHLAAITDMSRQYKDMYMVNVEGSKSVFERCAGAGVGHIIHMSSISVYGKKDNKNITEDTPPMPDTHYARTKYAAEKIAMSYPGKVCILRPSIIYGPGFNQGFYEAYRRIVDGNMFIVGDGKNHVPLVHARDVANAVVLSIAKRAEGVYNINNDDEMTQKELIEYVASLVNIRKTKFMYLTKFIARPLLGMYNFYRMVRSKQPIPYEFVEMLSTDRIVK